jgi:hypothetical protein
MFIITAIMGKQWQNKQEIYTAKFILYYYIIKNNLHYMNLLMHDLFEYDMKSTCAKKMHGLRIKKLQSTQQRQPSFEKCTKIIITGKKWEKTVF